MLPGWRVCCYAERKSHQGCSQDKYARKVMSLHQQPTHSPTKWRPCVVALPFNALLKQTAQLHSCQSTGCLLHHTQQRRLLLHTELQQHERRAVAVDPVVLHTALSAQQGTQTSASWCSCPATADVGDGPCALSSHRRVVRGQRSVRSLQQHWRFVSLAAVPGQQPGEQTWQQTT